MDVENLKTCDFLESEFLLSFNQISEIETRFGSCGSENVLNRAKMTEICFSFFYVSTSLVQN